MVERQERKVGAVLGGEGDFGQTLKEEFHGRFSDETSFREMYFQKVKWALGNDCLFEGQPDLLSSAVEAIRVAGHVGILPQNVRREHSDLLNSASNYATSVAKIIV